jgi:hypothetical protein
MRRQKVKKSGNVATLLLEVFLEGNGKLRAAQVYEKNLCEKNQFYIWRKEMCDTEWLVFELTNDGKVARYYPGRKLKKYINKEKKINYELASTKDLYESEEATRKKFDQVNSDYTEIKKRVKSLEAAMDRVINILDPDTNPKKREAYQAGKYDHKLESLLLHSTH